MFVERLWRSMKYEEVYLRAYGSISTARQGLGWHLDVLQPKQTAQGN